MSQIEENASETKELFIKLKVNENGSRRGHCSVTDQHGNPIRGITKIVYEIDANGQERFGKLILTVIPDSVEIEGVGKVKV